MTTITEDLEDTLQNLLLKFWVQEEVPRGLDGKLNPDQHQCERHYEENQTRAGTGRVQEIERRLPKNYLFNHKTYYLPHHGVLKPDSANLNPDIFDVLIWIRRHRHLFSTDIMKMYRQILVHQDDWDLQRILWMDEQGNEVIYQLTTVTYGIRTAPFLAVRTLLQLLHDEGDNYLLAIPSLKYGRYVDGIFGGADNLNQLVETATQLRDL
ncbi:PREDICTED: uncharacterized protein LOC105366967 [Ceratosolen solmsi marchali]|uniref:Uncharacterized protein LOC105366967 n=1 Tax=Ceratosolen solmsi marchali TaxID=326594 RepID=A0AAJ6YTH4_9HYME|nr:PREDICTED: uncharacterized protein LOC105366967 [Ceratosolen solmsi marchali]